MYHCKLNQKHYYCMTSYEKHSSRFVMQILTKNPKIEKFTAQIALVHIPSSGRLYLEHTHQKSCLAFIYFLANFRLDMSSHIFHSFSAKDTRSKTVPALHFTLRVEILFYLMEHFIFKHFCVLQRNPLSNLIHTANNFMKD